MPDTSPPEAEIQTGQPDKQPTTHRNGPPSKPLMRLVTKGWWVMREERVPIEVLEAANREAEKKIPTRFKL
jgi:hypothetical protein